jgi:hypothetical protein
MSKRTTKKRALSPRVSELVRTAGGQLPVWVRAPIVGVEHYSGFSRAKLYQLTSDGKIRSVSIREPGAVKGTRLFHLQSILDYVAKCEQLAVDQIAA